jgi:hypothetical protein
MRVRADTGGVECAPIRAQAWLDVHERDFGDLHVEAAVELIERAGLSARVVPYASGRTTEEQRSDRVSVWLAEDGAVRSVDAG